MDAASKLSMSLLRGFGVLVYLTSCKRALSAYL